jgi:tetratricopeptide (TPR) repeat protein
MVIIGVWTKVGEEHLEQGQREEAIRDFKKAIEVYSMNESAKLALQALDIREEEDQAEVDGTSCVETSSTYSNIKQRILEQLLKLKAQCKISGKTDVEIEINTQDTSHEDVTRYCLDELHLSEAGVEFDSQNCLITISPEALGILGVVELGVMPGS